MAGIANAQQTESRWQLQLRGGALATGLYKGPLQKHYCREGCPVYAQTPLAAPMMLAGVARKLAPNHSIYLLGGISRLRFYEEGAQSPGDETLDSYELKAGFSLIQGQLGHQWQWRRAGQYAFVLSNGLILERSITEQTQGYPKTYLNELNASYVGKVGVVLWPDRSFSLSAEAVFRSALTSYNRDNSRYFDDYYPWGAGLELGINYNW